MSIIDDDDELEEVEEEEGEREEEQEKATPTTLDPPDVDDDEEEEAKQHSRDNFIEINAKRKLNKKATALRFLLTFALNNKKTLETISKHVGITSATGRKYLNEYVAVVINALEGGTYPDSVLQFYNSPDIPVAQRLKVSYIESLRPVVIRYNNTNIESLMRQMGQGEIIEEDVVEEQQQVIESDPEEELLDDYVQQGGKFKEFNEAKQQKRNVNVTIRALNANSPIQDIIRFGIHNCGQPDDAKIRKVIAVFMNAPAYYLSDESVFVNLLEANNINAKTVTAFMNWFKHVAPISPQQRQGFLNLNGPSLPQQQQQQGQQKAYNNFDINDYDEFAQYLYQQGIYKYGLPPNHRVNQESYEEYLEEKRQEKIEKQNNRQFNNALKQRVLEMQSNRFMGNGGTPQQGGIPNQGVAFDDKYLIEKGIVVPEVNYDMAGNRSIRLVPTGRTVNDVYSGGGGAQSKPDQFLESVSVVTRLIEALKPALNMGGGSTNPLMDKFMEAAISKLINKAEESPTQVLDRELSLFDRLQKVFPQNGGGNRPKTDSELQAEIEMLRINQDGKFAEQEIALKQKDYDLKQEMMKKQEEESKNGIEMILGWLGKGFEMVSPILNSVLAGNMGGGIGNILGGMMPGGGGGAGGPFGGPQQQPFIPPQPQSEFEVVEPNSFVPPTNVVPQDFLPQQQAAPEYTQQPTYEQPQPVYEQQYTPQPQPQQYEQQQYPSEQYQAVQPPEEDFLDSVSAEDLEGLTVGQLDEITNRIESKASKIEKLLNSIKTTKVRKQFGYNKPSQKKTIKKTTVTTQNNEDYSLLDVPPTMNPDYDGISGNRDLVEEFIEVPDVQPTFLNYDTDIYGMGNDNQQFNQQNDANQPEYIAKIAAQEKAENLKAENERRKAKGLAPLPDGTVVDESGQQVSEDSLKASDNKFENSDKYNDNPGLDENKSQPSEQFQKDHKATGNKAKSSDNKQYDAEDATKEKEKKVTADHKYDNTKAKNK